MVRVDRSPRGEAKLPTDGTESHMHAAFAPIVPTNYAINDEGRSEGQAGKQLAT